MEFTIDIEIVERGGRHDTTIISRFTGESSSDREFTLFVVPAVLKAAGIDRQLCDPKTP
jgi:hypothetical protein